MKEKRGVSSVAGAGCKTSSSQRRGSKRKPSGCSGSRVVVTREYRFCPRREQTIATVVCEMSRLQGRGKTHCKKCMLRHGL